ncbi:Pycsar system effector family protein [Streptomyces sp. NPDC003077]|uniref:Pycsar system effector family protein n=1 Tax=Streptomyces sp. NPDC003077 TaxID=3154443 RepID=UPI0033B32982
MERVAAANTTELTRADTKAAVLLGFMGAALGTFLTVTRAPASGRTASPWGGPDLLWWSAVLTAFLAIVCFVCAIAPRRRRGRRQDGDGPGYFEHVARVRRADRLLLAFERAAHDPAAPLLASLRNTSAIIRAKYRWIELGAVLAVFSVPQLAAALRPA